MGLLSKAWKGIKKTVKKAAKGVKKLASKSWKAVKKVGKKALGAVAKISDKLGPLGMIGLSVLAPYAATLWQSFGAASAAAGGFWGSVGSAVYNAGNFVSGTIGSMTSGISEAIGNIASGSFKAAGDSLVQGFSNAFTGQAGSAAMTEAANAATQMALKDAAASAVTQFSQAPTGFMDATPVAGQSMGVPMGGSQTMQGLSSTGTTQVALQSATNVGAETMAGSVAGGSLLSKVADVGSALLQTDFSGGQTGYQPITSGGGMGLFGTVGAQGQGGIGSGGGEFLSDAMRKQIQEQSMRMQRGFGGRY